MFSISKKNAPFILILLILAISGLLFYRGQAASSEWLPGFKYRLTLEVRETSGFNLKNQQVRVVLDSSFFNFDFVKSDGSDIRFTDKNGNPLSYWIEKWPSKLEIEEDKNAQAVIWVKVPDLKPYETEEIFLYYGNPQATSYSNLLNTMDFIEVIESEITSTPVKLNFSTKPDYVIASPPYDSTVTASSIYVFTENNDFFALCSNQPYNVPESTPKKAYFLGIKKGFYSYNGIDFEAKPKKVSSFTSLNTPESFDAYLFSGSNQKNSIYIASIFDKPLENLQLQLLQPKFLFSLWYGSSLTLAMESDNTTSSGSALQVCVLKADFSHESATLFDAISGTYQQVSFYTTATTEISTPAFDRQAIFASIENDSKQSLYPVFIPQNGNLTLKLLSDLKTMSTKEATAKISLLIFNKPGIYVVAKKPPDEPIVRFAGLKGRVFEDKNLNFQFDGNDVPIPQARVRLYEDIDNDGKISPPDRFISETITDDDGFYAFPVQKDKNYLVAVSAYSCGESISPDSENPPPIPEEVFHNNYRDGKVVQEIKFGGENPNISDYWSEDPDPLFNIYEHRAKVEISDEEEVAGIDFGFSFGVVVNTIDSELPCQGTLRQAIYNSNILPGKQKISFYLDSRDVSYFSLLNEYEINISKPLPPISDAVEIDGKNLNSRFSSANLLIRGVETSSSACFEVYAPGVQVKNLKISGFNKGIIVQVPQFERGLKNKIFTFTGYEDLLSKIEAVKESDLCQMPTFHSGGLSVPGRIQVSGEKNSEFKLLERKNRAPGIGQEQNNLIPEGKLLLYSNGNLLALSAKKSAILGLNGSFLKLNSNSSNPLFLESSCTVASLNGTASFLEEKGKPDVPMSYSGKKFVIPFFKESEVFVCSSGEEETTVKVSINSYEAAETTVKKTPFKLSSTEEDGILSLESSSPVLVLLEHSSSLISVPFASKQIYGIFKESLLIAADENTYLTVYGSTLNGESFSANLSLEAGSLIDLGLLPTLKNYSSKIKAAVIVSSKPVQAFGVIKETKTSMVPFLPEELLATEAKIISDAEKLIIASFGPTGISLKNSSSNLNLNLSGTIIKPEITEIKNPQLLLEISSNKPVYLIQKEKVTGKYILPLRINDMVLPESASLEALSKYAFDSENLIENVSFLSCDTGIFVAEGTGVSVKHCRFISCNEKIKINEVEQSKEDGLISIEQTNLGVDTPVINYAVYEEPTLTISGYVGSTESATFDTGTLEIYLADYRGNQGIFLGETTLTNGSFSLKLRLEAFKPKASDFVIAVFTFKDGSTSEFSAPVRIDPAPVITDVKATHITPIVIGTTETLTTTITWVTDIPATSKVVYDTSSHASTETYAFETTETTSYVTTHTVVITGLSPNTLYYFRVISKNEYGDTAISYEYLIPPGRTIPDTDLCAACHRAHTAIGRPLKLPSYVRP